VNIKEYIESGILEAYALGALEDRERTEVERNIAMYPELATELEGIERTMLQMAEEQAVTPPDFMLERIWIDLNEEARTEKIEEPVAAPKTIPLVQPATTKPSWQRAAVWAAIVVSVLTNIVLLSQRNSSREQQDILAAKVDSMNATQQQLSATLDAYKKEKEILAAPGMQTIVMRREGNNSMAGMVYWSKDKGDTYLALHNMPMPPKGKQYQLWVIQDGKPVDMGVISNDMVARGGMMQKIPMTVLSSQAFAISLEKEGGNPTPTEVYMVGATS
jgi:anti-sigma-K factor RskA